MIRTFALLVGAFLVGCGGAPGPVGPQGPVGPAGVVAGVVSGFSCTTIQGGLYFAYRSSTLASGDLFVECEVSGASFQSSQAILYKATQSGAGLAGCVLTYDSSGAATSGFWTFTSSAGVRQATYHDGGDAQDGAVVTFSSCSSL